ncbi:MAG: qseG [Enterobacter kobei]|nr:qseG [Enterobacter kobei]
MNLRLVSMSHIFNRVLNAVSLSGLLRAGLPCLLLTGCIAHVPKSAVNEKQEEKLPQHQLADFLSTDCNDIWSLHGKSVWREGQALQLQLSEERYRYSKLQQSADGELDTLRQQQQYLREQLETTSRKLENLTDIERRLSTRKPAGNDLPSANPDVKNEDASHDKP